MGAAPGAGVDVDKALARMKGNKDAYRNFLIEFFDDPDFEALGTAIRDQNVKSAFEYAHGLEGDGCESRTRRSARQAQYPCGNLASGKPGGCTEGVQ